MGFWSPQAAQTVWPNLQTKLWRGPYHGHSALFTSWSQVIKYSSSREENTDAYTDGVGIQHGHFFLEIFQRLGPCAHKASALPQSYSPNSTSIFSLNCTYYCVSVGYTGYTWYTHRGQRTILSSWSFPSTLASRDQTQVHQTCGLTHLTSHVLVFQSQLLSDVY